MVATSKRPTEAWHSSDLFEAGMGHVCVARFKSSGEVEIGVFLVDMFCLGVKDAFFTRLSTEEYDPAFLDRLFREGRRTALTPACARKLVEDSVAYARALGFDPHPDYKKGARVFGGIQAVECGETFVFGKDGKPLYVEGPHDSPAFVERVMGVLTRRLGADGFHYMLSLDPDASDEDLEEWDGEGELAGEEKGVEEKGEPGAGASETPPPADRP